MCCGMLLCQPAGASLSASTRRDDGGGVVFQTVSVVTATVGCFVSLSCKISSWAKCHIVMQTNSAKMRERN